MTRTIELTLLAAFCICLISCSTFTSSSASPDQSGQQNSSKVVKEISGTDSMHRVPMDSIGAVSWLSRSGNPYFLKGANNDLYVYINIRGNDMGTAKKRAPLNISLVLDRSGSMQGQKIAYAKKAANFVIDQLNGDDMASIVNYDDQVEITSASQPVKNKTLLHQRINELTDRGATNLTGGMLEGYTQAKSTRKDGYVNRVLLLTDGLANEGITDPAMMRKLVEKKYNEEGIALSTFGLGADYNEDLLTQLAEVGRANYYFIDSPDKIPTIFARELKGLLSVVAQNAWVEINVPPQLELVKVYGYPAETKGNNVVIKFNDVFTSDEKGILVRLKSKSPLQEKINLNCQLHYTDAASFQQVINHKELVVQPGTDSKMIDKNKDALVEEMIALYESTEQFEEIMNDVDAGNYEAAKVKADSAVKYLKLKQQYTPSAKLKMQEENLNNYKMKVDTVKTMREEEKRMYQKSNKSVNYSIKKGRS